MARINLYEELPSDPRFTFLTSQIPRHEAFGSLICLWELGQAYWKKDRSVIPHHLGDRLANIEHLVRSGFVTKTESGYYCSGAKDRWDFLLVRSEHGRKGGLASAAARKEKYGSAIPNGASNRSQTEANAEAKSSKPKPSSSSSSSLNKENNIKEISEESEREPVNLHKLALIWNEYSGDLPKVLAMNKDRIRKCNQRWKEATPDDWIEAVCRVANSAFCGGKNDRGWIADFDFFIRPNTRLKIVEGKYDNRKQLSLVGHGSSGICGMTTR